MTPHQDLPQQLELFADFFAPIPSSAPKDALAQRLGEILDQPISSLVLTENKTRIVSARQNGEGLDVRIHRCFVDAPTETLRHVADFLGSTTGAARRWALAGIREHFDRHREARRRRRRLDPVGEFFDLDELRDDINRRYFDGALDLQITWGRRLSERRKGARGYSVRLGAFHNDDGLVRIHRSLDREGVPLYVLESVVYHEMLHAVVPVVKHRGERRRIHTMEFRRRERLFERHREAERWISKNLAWLAGVDA